MRLLPGRRQAKVRFEFAAPAGNEVFVAGTFNNWDPRQFQLHDNPDEGLYATVIPLQGGHHEYKFIVNGEWCVDQNCPDCVPNGAGSLNSVINV